MRYWWTTAILLVTCSVGGVRGQACFLERGHSAIGGFVGGTTSQGRSGADAGVLISENARADVSFGLQTLSFDRGSTENFIEQTEVFLVIQRSRRVSFLWSLGQSFSMHLPIGDEGGPTHNVFGCFSTLSTRFQTGKRSALRPAAGVIWEKVSTAEVPAEWGGLVSLDVAGGDGSRGTLFVATFAVSRSFEHSDRTTFSATLALVGVKEHRRR